LLEAGSKGSKREGDRRCLLRLGLRGVRKREEEGERNTGRPCMYVYIYVCVYI